ncbi:hypothetical protein XENTR_v10018508 [Xenopus tropicalis]|nr:hypothetical protein XENTR_v10018508 [Xenopus tropicalis]
MDNRFATALVIGSVLSLLSVIYLSAAVGTVSWYHYFTSSAQANISYTTPEDFTSDAEKMDEKAYTDALFHFNGSLGLWQRCITVPQDHLSQQLSALTDSPTLFSCVFLSLSDQFLEKYQEPGNHNSEIDIVRTCVCTLGSVLCFSSGIHMLEQRLPLPTGIRGEYGWSFCLACVCSPLQVMAGALFLWASRASRREYSLMKAYRVA